MLAVCEALLTSDTGHLPLPLRVRLYRRDNLAARTALPARVRALALASIRSPGAWSMKPKKKASKKPPLPPLPPSKVPHPVDDLIQAEPKMDEKLQSLDPRKLGQLGRITRMERGFCGEMEW